MLFSKARVIKVSVSHTWSEGVEVEFKNLDDRIEVLEYAIRTTNLESEGIVNDQSIKHLQGRLLVNDTNQDCLNCSISYYSSSHEFLGLDDSGLIYLKPAGDRSVSMSLPMDIPLKASKAIVRFIFDDEVSGVIGFYGFMLKAFSILILLWLAITVINSF